MRQTTWFSDPNNGYLQTFFVSTHMIESRIKAAVRDIQDFPKPGILFKDITPILLDNELVGAIADEFASRVDFEVDVMCAVESRGFFFGTLIAERLGIPFIPIRKQGKLPGDTIAYSYDLEYGSATIELHKGHLIPGQRVLIHDDLLATGGTVAASSELVKREGAEVAGFSFLVNLSFLDGETKIKPYSSNIISLATY